MSIQKIILNEDGSFSDDPKKVFYIKTNDTLKVQLSSTKRLNSLFPILLTSLDFERIRSKSKFLDQLEVKKSDIVTLKGIGEKYTVFNGNFDDEGGWYAYVPFSIPGSVFLQVIFVSNQEYKSEKFTIQEFGRPEWVIVESILKINRNIVSHRELIVQTLISKCMGPIDRWEALISQQTSLNYNAFHLTPIQKLGYSNSCYSIKDQLDYSVINFPNMSKEEAYVTLKEKINLFEAKYKAIFLVDILLNHTAFDSPWLAEHPESCYNTHNTPSLTSAYVLDQALADFSNKIANREYLDYPETCLRTEQQLDKIMNIIKNQIIPPLKLEEYFLIDEQAEIQRIKSRMNEKYPTLQISDHPLEHLNDAYNDYRSIQISKLINESIQYLGAAPLGVTFNLEKVYELFEKEPKKFCYDFILYGIKRVNGWNYNRAKHYLDEAVRNIRNAIHYHRVQGNNHDITTTNSLVIPYFTNLKDGKTKAAHNGWMFNYNVLEDFADSDQFYFLRRLVIPWGDLVKLRYGKSKQDSPYLWKRMKKHVVEMASVFHGFRLDNAHSTPIHVAEYFIRKARKCNPSLFVFAELFTGSKETDALFTKRLGLNAVLREALHANHPADLARDVFEMSLTPELIIGSVDPYTEFDYYAGKKTSILKPTVPHPIYYDLTHDNQIYMNIRTFRDTLPTSALMCMANCLIATTKGHDEFYKEKINVTTESRLYSLENDLDGMEYQESEVITHLHFDCGYQQSKVEVKGSWDDWTKAYNLYHIQNGIYTAILRLKPGKYEFKYIVNGQWIADPYREVNEKTGNHYIEINGKYKIYPNIIKARQKLNLLHQKIYAKYPGFHSYLTSGDVFVVHRERNSSLKNLVLIARSAFKHGMSNDVNIVIDLPGIIEQDELKENQDGSKELIGMKGVVVEETDLHKFASVNLTDSKASQTKKYHSLKFKYMPPSFVCVLKVKLHESQMQSINALEELQSFDQKYLYHKLFDHLHATDVNHLFFSCSNEEKDKSGHKFDIYSVPGLGPLPYAGLGGMLKQIHDAQRYYNNLGTPLFENLRNGDWLLDYMINRLQDSKTLSPIREWIINNADHIKFIPRHLIPKYFVRLFNTIHQLVELHVLNHVKIENLKSSSFFRKLVFSSYQMIADIPSSRIEGFNFTLAAGIPQLATGLMRCWGRDTFIAFKGAFLISGLHQQAKDIIMMFASRLRHGLIPNSLNCGAQPRYNSRDAVWWFIKSIGDYIEFTGDNNILRNEVGLKFLSDELEEHERKFANKESRVLLLQDIIQEIFQKHAQGIRFREWNSGENLDPNMKAEGFDIQLQLHEQTGFIIGGNTLNCLTWMDKIGASDKAGNKGIPASARDGAPIEATALLFNALKLIIRWNSKIWYPYEHVSTVSGKLLSFKDWSEKIRTNFEFYYWIPDLKEQQDFKNYDIEPEMIKKSTTTTSIYKDTVKSKIKISEYRLRPNCCIAIAVAPELFEKDKAIKYLEVVESHLIKCNSIGIKTLDPSADEYASHYDQGNDSSGYKIARGFNYHNGPEWVWIYGMFLLAKIEMRNNEFTFLKFMNLLTNHKKHLETGDWMSLPDMTNDNGGFCWFSSSARAVSTGVILEAYYEAKERLK